MKKKISAINALSFGFKATLEHIRLFVAYHLITLSIYTPITIVICIIANATFHPLAKNILKQDLALWLNIFKTQPLPLPFLIVLVIATLITVLIILGSTKMALNIHDRNASSISVIFAQYDKLFQGLIAFVLYLSAVILGTFLCVIPGVIALVRFSLFPFFLVDKNVGAIESLNMSYNATDKCFWNLLGIDILFQIIVSLKSLTQFSILFTIPLLMLARVHVYRQIIPRKENSDQDLQ